MQATSLLAPGYSSPAQPGSPFHLASPDREPLPACTRALIVVEDHGAGERRITTWSEIEPRGHRAIIGGEAAPW